MVLDVAVHMLLLRPSGIVYRHKVLIVITELEIGLVEKRIFLDVRKHLQCAAALVEVIVIGKEVAELFFQLLSCLIGQVKDIQIIGVEGAAV